MKTHAELAPSITPSAPDHTLAFLGVVGSVWFGLPAIMMFFTFPTAGWVLGSFAAASAFGAMARIATSPSA